MWIRKMPAEINLEKRTRFARSLGADLAIGLAAWYGLVCFSALFKLPYSAPASPYVALGLVALIIPASLRGYQKSEVRYNTTTVCDRCNNLKTVDGVHACRCGGTYFLLPEMKWVTPAGTQHDWPNRRAALSRV